MPGSGRSVARGDEPLFITEVRAIQQNIDGIGGKIVGFVLIFVTYVFECKNYVLKTPCC